MHLSIWQTFVLTLLLATMVTLLLYMLQQHNLKVEKNNKNNEIKAKSMEMHYQQSYIKMEYDQQLIWKYLQINNNTASMEQSMRMLNFFDLQNKWLLPKDAFKPTYDRQRNATFIFGIRVVPENLELVISRLHNLLILSFENEEKFIMFIVYIGQQQKTLLQKITEEFEEVLYSQLIRIIITDADYYQPQVGLLAWQQENFDYINIMLYAQSADLNAHFYMQMSDSMTEIFDCDELLSLTFSLHLPSQWLLLDLNVAPFAGKLFPMQELGKLTVFMQMFYKQQNMGSLLRHYAKYKFCGNNLTADDCKRVIAKLWVKYNYCVE